MCLCRALFMFETAREDLARVIVAGSSRSGLEFLVKELSSLESSVAAASNHEADRVRLGSYQPTRPSTISRIRSAWPLWRADSSIMCT